MKVYNYGNGSRDKTDYVPYSGKLLWVHTFANMPSEAPEEVFTVLIFATKPCLISTVPTGLLKFSAVFIFAKLDHPRKPQKFAPCKNFPLYGMCTLSVALTVG